MFRHGADGYRSDNQESNMEKANILKRDIKATFDLYGTVVDMQKDLTEKARSRKQKLEGRGTPVRHLVAAYPF